MRKKRPHKLENRVELNRIKTRVDNELKKENPNWDSIDGSLVRLKVVFRHAQFSNLEDKKSYEQWIDATEKRCNQRRQQAAKEQRLQLLSLFSTLRCTVKSLENTNPLNQTRTSYAWKEIRQATCFLKHTHFASADDKQRGLDELHQLTKRVKKYEKEELKRPSPQRSIVLYQIRQFAEKARPLSYSDELTENYLANLERQHCPPEIFKPAKTLLERRRRALAECSQSSREAWALYDLHKFLMLNQHKADTFRELRDIQKQLHTAWDTWLAHWRKLYAARLAELKRSAHTVGELRALECANLSAQLARRHAHKIELEEKLESGQDPRFQQEVRKWLVVEKEGIASLSVKIKALKPTMRPTI